jgi:hypothetical protein
VQAMNNRYRVIPGRSILRDGKPIFDIVRVVDENANANISPAELDDLTIAICEFLNRWKGKS